MAGRTGGSSGDLRLSPVPLLLAATLIFFARVSYADEIFLTVNVKKPLALTSDKFLSYTLDPTVVLTGDALTRNLERSINMARALSPAYVRIGGPRSNSYTFVRPRQMYYEEDPQFTITESNWIDVNRWAENAGLDILVCITPQHTEIGRGDSVWDSRNALDLISFSDHMGFNNSWQLGYECQTRCDVTGIDGGKAVMRLRSMLDAFPRYSKSLVTGPDVVAYRTKQQQQYLQDYLNVAGNALSAITWHPNFSGITLEDEGVSMQHDTLATDRDSLYRFVGRPIWKKPLWIAESKPEDCKKQYLGALVWTRRLGNAARLGVQVIMRKPNASNGLQPTPDYWVSVLHKALVGREVLDAKISNGNRSHVHFYCQCTRPSLKYEKGSLTIFGINLTPEKIVVNLKNLKVKTIHKYILLPGFDADNRMFSETVQLNNVPLKLINERELPKLRPAMMNTSKGVSLKLPPGGIGFWVLPGLKIKSCGSIDDDATEITRLRRLSKRLEETDSEEDDGGGEKKHYNENFWLKSNKTQKRSKQYFKGEKDAEKYYIKMEAEKDLEKLEKLLRKRESFDDWIPLSRGRKSPFDFDDRSREKRFDGNNFEDETNRELRDKLREYKRRLKQYEYKIKRVEPLSRAYAMDSEEMVDSETVIDAMRLISKMETALRKLEVRGKASQANRQRYGVNNAERNPNNVRSQDDAFLDKLLDSKKIKRTSVPSRIEDQLRAIYQMLADERERRQRNNSEAEQSIGKNDGVLSSTTPRTNSSRPRRDVDKKFGVDPLGLRKEGLYRRLSRFTDETRNRRNQRKENHRDQHAFIIDSKDVSDSEEDDFYGFHKREPVKGFPTGDVHLSIGNSDEETSSDDDYEMNDDDERSIEETTRGFWKHETPRAKLEKHKDLWVEIENRERSRVPIDYSGNVRISTSSRIHKNRKGRREFWENESVDKKTEDFSSAEIDRLVTVQKIVPEQYPNTQQDQRTKESMVDKLISYFKASTVDFDQIPGYGSAEELQPARIDTRTPVQITTSSNEFNLRGGFDVHHQTPVTERKCVESEKRCENESCSDESERSTAVKAIEFDKSSGSSEERETPGVHDTSYKITDEPAKRRKRSTNDLLEDVLDHEMIYQDDNNLKDCDCRVPRSTGTATEKVKVKRGKKLNFPRKKTANASRRGFRKPVGLRKNLKPAETSVSKLITDQKKNNSGATRRKRSLNPSDGQITHSTTEMPVFVPGSAKNEEIPRTTEVTVQELSETPTNHESLPKQPELKNGKVTEDLSLNSEMINGMSETETARHIVKRGDKSRSLSKVLQSQAKHSEAEESLTAETEPTEEIATSVTTIAPNTKLFRFRKNRKESARKVNETREETSYSESTTVPSVGAVRSPFYRGNKILSSRKTATSTTEATSSPAVPGKNSDELITKIQDTDAVLKKSSKTSNKREKPESALSKLRRKLVTTSTTTSTTTPTTTTPTTTTPTTTTLTTTTTTPTIRSTPRNLLKQARTLTTETTVKLNKRNKAATTPMPPITSPESPTEHQTTTLAPIKATTKNNDGRRMLRAKRIEQFRQKLLETSPSTPPVSDPMKNNDEKKPAKLKRSEVSQGNRRADSSSAGLAPTQNDDEEKSLKSNKSESLQKLQEKLRHKREKLVNAYRKELLSEIDAASEKNRQMYQREIMNKMMNEAELQDLVDQAKSEYLKHKKPMDYEIMAKLHGVNETETIKQEFVTEILEILRPLYVARERNLKPQIQNVRATIDPELLKSQTEPSEAEKVGTRLNDDTANHKIARRDGEPYPGDVKSLQTLPFHEQPTSEEDFLQIPSIGIEKFTEWDETLENSSVGQSDKKVVPNYAEENRFDYSHEIDEVNYDSILNPGNKATIPSSELSGELENSMRDAGSHHHVLLETNPEQSPSESPEKLLKLMQQTIPVHKTSDDIGTTDIKAMHLSKKRNLENSDFDTNSKYNSPNYATLSIDKSLQQDKAPETNMNSRENETTLENVESKILKEKTIEPGNKNTSWIVKRLMDNFQENHSAMIDYADLDEALNSGDYELVMLIPVNSNQKKHRRKRHVKNLIIRDPEDSITNHIKIELTPEKPDERSTRKGAELVYDNHNTRMNEIVLNRLRSMDLVNDHEKDDYSMTGYSIPIIDKKLKTLNENDVKLLENGLPEEKPFQSVPEIIFTLRKKSFMNEASPDLLEDDKPKLQYNVAADADKVRWNTESFEKFIDNFEDRFNQQRSQFEIERDTSNRNTKNDVPVDSDFFGTTFLTVKKLFNLLSGIVGVFGAN